MSNKLGHNGTNWFEVQTSQDKQWLLEALAPGQTYVHRFRADKDPGISPHIDALIDLHAFLLLNGRYLEVVFTAGLDESSVTDNIYMIDALHSAGVNIIAIEAGNEYYSREQANFDFEVYRTKFEPLLNALTGIFAAFEFAIFLAPQPSGIGLVGGRNDHKKWNDAAFAYMQIAPANVVPSIHIYFNEGEVPTMTVLPERRVVTGNAFDTQLDDYFFSLYTEALLNDHWATLLDYIRDNVGVLKNVYVTEWGYAAAGELKNTFGYSATAFRIWNNMRTLANTILLEHNGIAKTNTGFISPASAFDINPEGFKNMRRLDYWVFKLLNEIPVGTPLLTGLFTALTEGVHYLYFINITTEPIETNIAFANGLRLKSGTLKYIQGSTYYSGCGAAAYMKKGTTPSMEISGPAVMVAISELPQMSFGYIKIEVEKIPVVVKPDDNTGENTDGGSTGGGVIDPPRPSKPKKGFWKWLSGLFN